MNQNATPLIDKANQAELMATITECDPTQFRNPDYLLEYLRKMENTARACSEELRPIIDLDNPSQTAYELIMMAIADNSSPVALASKLLLLGQSLEAERKEQRIKELEKELYQANTALHTLCDQLKNSINVPA